MPATTVSNSASVEEMREVAARICRDYLHGAWKTVTAEDIKFRRISGGLSNFLYYVSLPDDFENINSNGTAFKRLRRDSSEQEEEPKEVLLRVYGQSHGDSAMLTELVVFTLLSERNLGPKLHGIFPGGRIEQYIPARALKTNELSKPHLTSKIAEKMAKIHTLNIPISKEPEWIWKTMGRWLKNSKAVFDTAEYECTPQQRVIIQEISKTDLAKEVLWLKSVVESGNYPVKFCHNDLQEGNILLKGPPPPTDTIENEIQEVNNTLSSEKEAVAFGNLQSELRRSKRKETSTFENSKDALNGNISSTLTEPALERRNASTSSTLAADYRNGNEEDCDPELIIIDYEYCAYNYRGFDLANHFVEWTFDYTCEEFPFYFHKKHQYPTPKERDAFIVQYLKTLNDSHSYEPSQEEVDGIIEEVHCFTMASHLFWTLWSIVNVHQVIEFGYWEYGQTRLKEYFAAKNFFMDKYLSDRSRDLK